MKVHELIMELEDMDQDAEVRLAIQPAYPFQHSIEGVYKMPEAEEQPNREHFPANEQGGDDYEDAMFDWEDRQADHPGNVVYIAEGGQLGRAPYLPAAAADLMGWSR